MKDWQVALVLPQASWVLETLLHRLVRDLSCIGCSERNRSEDRRRIPTEIGAAAGNRTRTCSLARSHSPVKSQPRKLKGRERSCSQPMPFQQRTNTSCYLAIPTHGFTVVLSVFWGTPPAKPLKCKNVSNRLGARFRSRWADPTGGRPRPSCAWIRFVLSDIIKTSFRYRSQLRAFRCCHFTVSFRKQKTLLTFR